MTPTFDQRLDPTKLDSAQGLVRNGCDCSDRRPRLPRRGGRREGRRGDPRTVLVRPRRGRARFSVDPDGRRRTRRRSTKARQRVREVSWRPRPSWAWFPRARARAASEQRWRSASACVAPCCGSGQDDARRGGSDLDRIRLAGNTGTKSKVSPVTSFGKAQVGRASAALWRGGPDSMSF